MVMEYKNRWTDRQIDNMDMAFVEIVQTGSSLHADLTDRTKDITIPNTCIPFGPFNLCVGVGVIIIAVVYR